MRGVIFKQMQAVFKQSVCPAISKKRKPRHPGETSFPKLNCYMCFLSNAGRERRGPDVSLTNSFYLIEQYLNLSFSCLPSFEMIHRPFVFPPDDGRAVFAEFDGQPDVARVARVLGPPHVGHEDEAFPAGQREHVGALPAEGDFRLRPHAGVGPLLPRPPDGGSGEHAPCSRRLSSSRCRLS